MSSVSKANNLDDLFDLAIELKQYPTEWEEFNIQYELADNYLQRMMSAHLSSWRPVQDAPNVDVRDEIMRWKKIVPNYFQAIIWTTWMPPGIYRILNYKPFYDSYMIACITVAKIV